MVDNIFSELLSCWNQTQHFTKYNISASATFIKHISDYINSFRKKINKKCVSQNMVFQKTQTHL